MKEKLIVEKKNKENKLPKKILASILIAPPYDEKDIEEPLGDFVISNNLEKFKKQGGKIFIYQRFQKFRAMMRNR